MMGDSGDEDIKECDFSKVGREKDIVHKCNSDPGHLVVGVGVERTNPFSASLRYPSKAGTTRKCLLNMDGYSYVIGKLWINLIKFIFFFWII